MKDATAKNLRAGMAGTSESELHPTSYGINVTVENMAVTPRQASANIEVTSAEGRRTTIRTRRVTTDKGCDPAGTIRFDAAEAEAQAVIASGSAPFRYEVLLALDGQAYRGAAVWPDDQQADAHPSVRLSSVRIFRPCHGAD